MIWRTNPTQAFADALDGRAPADGEVAALVAVATRLCEVAAEAEPSPEFRSALRTRLLTLPMPVSAPAAFASRPGRRQPGLRRWTVAFATLMATTFGAGLSAASADTIPGDTLYPVKRALESTQLAFKRTDSSSGSFHLHLATERLTEVDALTSLNGRSSTLASATLAEFQRQADLGSDALLRSYLRNDSRSDLVALNRFSVSSTRQLAGLRGRLSAADITETQAVLDGLAVQSTRMCPDCSGSIAADTPPETNGTAAPTDAPTTTTSPTVGSSAVPTTASSTPAASQSPARVMAPQVPEQVPSNIPTAEPAKKQPPVADVLRQPIDPPTTPLADIAIVKELAENGKSSSTCITPPDLSSGRAGGQKKALPRSTKSLYSVC